MSYQSSIIPVVLEDGTEIRVEATLIGEQRVGVGDNYSFDAVGATIVSLANQLIKTIQNVKPDKAAIKFGLEIAVETGSLHALLLAKGSGKSNLEITLEWNNPTVKVL
jgi:hypothetical protein